MIRSTEGTSDGSFWQDEVAIASGGQPAAAWGLAQHDVDIKLKLSLMSSENVRASYTNHKPCWQNCRLTRWSTERMSSDQQAQGLQNALSLAFTIVCCPN